MRTGGQVLVDALCIHGVDTVFCVPGESYLPVLDALYDCPAIRTISCRHESGAANMAEAYGKLTGKPAVVLVTRGPGACHASVGVHIAQQDSTPMLVLIGQVDRGTRHREAFQEIDYQAFYGPLCKWVAEVDDPARLPELLSQALYRCGNGRPGPVALALPVDVLGEQVDVADCQAWQAVESAPAKGAVQQLWQLLDAASRPLMILGGPGWTPRICAAIQQFAERACLPVLASFRCQDRFDNSHELYAGELGMSASPALVQRVKDADLILCLGARLGEQTSRDYSLLVPPKPTQKLVHVYPSCDELGRVYQPDLAICASTGQFAFAIADPPALTTAQRTDWARAARLDYLSQLEQWPPCRGELNMAEVIAHLRATLPPEAILTTDAGNFAGWAQRFYQFRRFPTQLGPTNGAMGYGVPAAIAARLLNPRTPVVGMVGDGGALMTGQEIATAIHYGIDPVILLINNNLYGTIRMHQERDYPGRIHATDLTNPEFAIWAKSFGAYGELVTRTDDFPQAFQRAREAGRIALLELRLDAEAISARTTLTALRENARR